MVYALLLALALGLGSAHWATHGEYPFGVVRAGPWSVWPRAGSRDADPYTRAVIARSGDIPLGVGEGLLLHATVDSDGRPLDARCSYRIGPSTPQARFWTLTVYDAAGRPAGAQDRRNSFTSSEILRDAAGGFEILAAHEPRSGNWLMLPDSGRVSFVLRLYDTPASAGSAALDPRAVPGIHRLECAP